MTLRHKFILYLAAMHLLFAGAAWFFLRHNRPWLLAVEALFALSFAVGVWLLRALFAPFEMVRAGADLLRERDFTCRFLEVGHTDIDQLIRVYNRMVDHLREERQRLQEQHYFLDKVLKASPSGVVTLDFDGRIATANPSAERMLPAAGDLMGRRLSEIDSAFAAALDRLDVGASQVLPLLGRRRVKCQKSQFMDRGFPRAFVIMEELTEELRQSEKAAYEKLIRLMSHEVNNTIGAAGSLLQSCLNYRDQLRPDDRRDYESALQVVIERTAHLNTFMRGFADVVRLPAPDRRPCDVRALLEDIAVLMRPECRRRRVTWAWDIREPLGPLLLDKNQMEQVFLNVVKNAVEAIGEDGAVTIRMGRHGRQGYVAVEDTGGGLTPEVQAHLFTPFFTTKADGQGLGLTLVQEILTRHGFEFSLEGRLGEPTEFIVYF